MLKKTAIFSFIEPTPLNIPSLGQSFYKDQRLSLKPNILFDTIKTIKTAATIEAEMITDGDNPDFDLEAEIQAHPDSLFVKCFAIKADETNDNGDWFGKEELKKATASFVGVPVFTNHQNSDAEEARGKVVYSWWNDEKNGIDIIARVDAEAYPKLARGIKEEYIMGTSMGCQVQYSLCSICHNKAETPEQYCSHIRERKTRKISENTKCSYHKHGTGECPMCECKEGETNKLVVKDAEVFEFNYGIKFIENSFVVNPACHDCGVTEIIDSQAFLAKISSISDKARKLIKATASHDIMCTDQGCIRLAGQQEIDNLNEALDNITSVSQSMLQQKDQLDLEFLSDLVTVLSDLQNVVDELTQQGYSRLPSPDGTDQTGQPDGMGGQEQDMNAMQPMNPTGGGGSKVHTGPAGEAGNVTLPMASKKIDITKISKLLRKKVIASFSESKKQEEKRLRIGFRLKNKPTE